MRALRRLRATVSRWLAGFDRWVDGLDVYAPGSRVSDHEEEGRGWRCGG